MHSLLPRRRRGWPHPPASSLSWVFVVGMLLGFSGNALGADDRERVLLLLSGDNETSRQVCDGFSEEIRHETQAYELTRTTVGQLPPHPDPGGIQAIVALGAEALGRALEEFDRTPVLALLVASKTVEALAPAGSENGRRVSAVFLDQPPLRQIRLAQQLLPSLQELSFIHSGEGRIDLEAVRRAIGQAGLSPASQRVEGHRELLDSLNQLLAGSDALLALPDPEVFNPRTIKPILLTAIRHKKPVVGGFSAGYVKAGVLAGVYSTPTQMGHDGARTLLAMLGEDGTAIRHYPREFDVGVNRRVAEALGVTPMTESDLKQRLLAKERRP